MIILLGIIIGIIIVGLFIYLIDRYDAGDFEDYELPQVTAGRLGEKWATDVIKKVLQERDILLTNINIQYGDKVTELDNVVINQYGVFIIEVKNYSGTLIGNEEDYQWTKRKRSGSGEIYEKQVRNPINQVKRQIYILAKYLREYGIDVWVEGYVFLIDNNSPVHSKNVLESYEDISRAIHSKTVNSLSSKKILAIQNLLMD